MMTSAVLTSIQATSPLLGAGAGAAAAGFASSFFASALAAGLSAALSCASTAPVKATHTAMATHATRFFIEFSSERRRIGLAGADADDFFERHDEDLAVADLAGIGGLLDRLDHLLEHFVLDRGLDLDLRQEIDHVLRAAVELGMTLLPAEALHLGDGDPLHPDRRQRFADLVELERLDDCGNEFHTPPMIRRTCLWRGRPCSCRCPCCPSSRTCSTNRSWRRCPRTPRRAPSRSSRRSRRSSSRCSRARCSS